MIKPPEGIGLVKRHPVQGPHPVSYTHLVEMGATVLLAECDRERGLAAQRRLCDRRPGSGVFLPVDLTDEGDVEVLCGEVAARFGCPDVLFHNATLAQMGAVEELPLDAWNRSYAVNLLAPVQLTRAFLPAMREREMCIRDSSYPELKGKIKRLCLMGGSTSGGNITPAAEFNIWHDPEAAAIVFSSGLPITMCGLDVTEKMALRPEEIEEVRRSGRVGALCAQLFDYCQDTFGDVYKRQRPP